MRVMVMGLGVLTLCGCGSAVRHGPEVAMPAALQGELKVERVVATGKWSVVRPAFPQDFGKELNLGMQHCAGEGSRPVQLRLHVDRNHGAELLRGQIEIVDLRTSEVLGRFPVAATGPGTTRRFVGEICRKGFGKDWG